MALRNLTIPSPLANPVRSGLDLFTASLIRISREFGKNGFLANVVSVTGWNRSVSPLAKLCKMCHKLIIKTHLAVKENGFDVTRIAHRNP